MSADRVAVYTQSGECCKLFGDDDVTIRIMEYTCAREYLCAELMESLRGETEAENEQ